MERLLIVGAEHLVGSNLALAARDQFEVSICTASGLSPWHGCQGFNIPGATQTAMQALLDRAMPDWIVCSSEFSAANWEDAPESLSLARELATLDGLCAAATCRDVPVTVISSDAAFAAPGMFHDEQSPMQARGPRAEATRALEQICGGRAHLIVRTHAYGWTQTGDSLVEQIFDALQEGRPMPIDSARYSTPLLATDLATMLIEAHKQGLGGVYHLAGAERCNPLRFGCELASELGCSSTLYCGRLTTPNERDPLTKQETSLDSRQALRALGIAAPMVREGLHRFVEQSRSGYRDELLGKLSPALHAA